jgi:hypothetical protein
VPYPWNLDSELLASSQFTSDGRIRELFKMADEGLLVSLVCARHERQAAVDQAERLALENLMLARRAAELERRLEDLRAANASSGLSGLLGWSAPPPSHDDLDAELQARADENLQLQHAIFEQQREHEQQRKLHMHLCDADVALLRRALGEAEEEAENARAGIAAAIAERVRERTEQRANVDALHAVCYELQLKCKTTLDELDENTKLIERLRERDLEHRRWRARLRHAWRDEQARAEAEAAALAAAQAADAAAPATAPVAAADELRLLAHAAEVLSEGERGGGGEGGGGKGGGGEGGGGEGGCGEGGRGRSRQAARVSSSATGGSTLGVGIEVAALRAALLEADASRTAAERRADIATEELALSSERFQQQIGMLSDALAEQNAKEEVRRMRQLELREQRAAAERAAAAGVRAAAAPSLPLRQQHAQKQHGQQQRQEQLALVPAADADRADKLKAVDEVAAAGGMRGLASWAVDTVGSVSSAAVGTATTPLTALGGLGGLTESMSVAAMRRATRT